MKIHCECYNVLEIEVCKAYVEAYIWYATCELVGRNSIALMSKKEDTLKLALEICSAIDSDLFRVQYF